MSVFLVYVRDEQENKPDVRTDYGGGHEPPEPVWCADIVEATSRAQAKSRFLREWAGSLRSPVYHDDWPSLRVRLLMHDDSASYDERWARVHEVLDHDGRSCDCPPLPKDEA